MRGKHALFLELSQMDSGLCRALNGGPRKRYISVLTPGTRECGLIRREGLAAVIKLRIDHEASGKTILETKLWPT